MISGVKNKVRNVIPRWRKYSVAAAHGELSAIPKKRSTKRAEMPAVAHDRNLSAWMEEPSLCNATELVLSATVTNRREEQVKAAAIQIAQSGSRLVPELRALADRIIDDAPDDCFGRIPQIRTTRNFTYSEPHNPMGWADLALAYSSKGQTNKAERALKVAISLAPNNRHVLRSAAAYYVHSGDAEQAHDLLVRCQATAHDPWLSAAEIATASAAGRVSRNVRKARNELRHTEFSAKDATELAAAVGSVELAAGNVSQSKKLFRISLEHPNENSLAQAEWSITHRGLPLEIPRECIDKIGAFEAAAIDAFGGERWQVCADALWNWMQDQPVLVEPALTGSVVACDLLEDNRFAIAFTKKGLQSNPSEPLLYNNQAVAYARMYQLDEARRSLDKAVALADQEDEYRQTVLTATRGLLAFRSRNPEAGRTYYRNAIHMAVTKKRMEMARRAYIFWLQEEVFLEPSLASGVLQTMKPVLRVPNSSDFYKSVTGAVSHRITTLAQSAPSVATTVDMDFQYPPQLAVS